MVWHDRNNNGLVDSDEEGIPNITLQLFREGDDPLLAVPIATTTTDGSGLYSFNNLIAGRYFVYIPAPASRYPWSSTVTDGADNREDNDDNGDQSGGKGAAVRSPVTELVDEGNATLDFGFFAPASLGDLVWLDLNRDGVQDANETGWPDTPHKKGVPGVAVSLFTFDGALVDTTTTDTSGIYRFTELIPGYYYVQFAIPNGYELTVQDAAAATDIFDSDVALATLQTAIITITSGEHNPTLDMGLYLAGNLPPAAIGDFVWYDNDRDGIQDEGETGVPGVTVVLYRDDGTAVATTKTDSTGFYEFNSLPVGDYYLVFTPPVGYQLSTQNNGDNDNLDSDGDPTTGRTAVVSLSAGERAQNWDLGLYLNQEPAAIGNLVWFDQDVNGVQDVGELGVPGVNVALYRIDAALVAANSDESRATTGTLIATTVTNADGLYSFGNLVPGDYYLHFTTPTGYVPTAADLGGNDATDSDVDVATGHTPVTTLDAGEIDLRWDYGLWYRTAGLGVPGIPGSLGDYVWYDANNDGFQDSVELPASGITVILYNGLGELIAIDVTDSIGHYQFSTLLPGDFFVEFVTPPGYIVSPVGSDPSDGTDSNADPSTGRTPLIAVTAGTIDLMWDAGLYRPPTVLEENDEPQMNRLYIPVVSRLLIKLRALRGEAGVTINCANSVCFAP